MYNEYRSWFGRVSYTTVRQTDIPTIDWLNLYCARSESLNLLTPTHAQLYFLKEPFKKLLHVLAKNTHSDAPQT